MSLNNFIPEIWSANLIVALRKKHVFASLAQRRDGEINFGDRLRISELGHITVSPYVKNSTSITPETLQSAQAWLNIDQANYFAFEVDDVDKAQMNVEVMQAAMSDAAYQLADTMDSYMAGLYADCGLSVDSNDTPADITSLNVEEKFLEVAEKMDDENIPREGRFAIIPPWVHIKLVLAGISNLSDNKDVYINGLIGHALGFEFYLSNNVSKNSSNWDKTRIICGVKGKSFGLAEQIKSVEAFRPESSFSDAVKGLHVYGAKIIRPDMTCVLYADKTAES